MKYLVAILLALAALCLATAPFTAHGKEFRLMFGRSVASSAPLPVYVKDPPRRLYATDCNGTVSVRAATNCDGSPAFVQMTAVPLQARNCAGTEMVPFIAPGHEVSDVRSRSWGAEVRYTNGRSVELRRKFDWRRGWYTEVDYDD